VLAGVIRQTCVAARAGRSVTLYARSAASVARMKSTHENLRLPGIRLDDRVAATGAIAGAVYILGRRAIHDWTTISIAAVALLITIRWKVPEPLLIASAALAGAVLYH